MDLWIRSQDKLTMLKVNDIKIIDYRGLKKQIEESQIFSLFGNMEQMKSYIDKDGWGVNCNETCLGIYETKERASEVLDEIQMHIKKQDTDELLVNSDGIITGQKHYGRVYEMPKE